MIAEPATCSPMQAMRRAWKPVLPEALRAPVVAETDESVSPVVKDAAVLAEKFPNTWGQKFVKLVNAPNKKTFAGHEPLRVGVVLSGGQAAGGHNVIAGIFDYVKQCHAGSKLIGFKNGPHGIFTHNYVEITPEYMDQYRNMGGFDMICSGRHKIETEEQKKASMEICVNLDLHGIVIIGGDDSNTNGAILAEYFKANGCKTLVAGAPKTIDGDLKNEYIEISFGFDTAVKVYSELVGNLCKDAATNKDRYHFVRLMGRSATNIGLEVAIQTRANLLFVGEEVQAEKRSLMSICAEVADMVEARHKLGKDYGVVLLPEGLIEFIPEVGALISEINDILGDGSSVFDKTKLCPHSLAVFEELPEAIRGELLLERDSHGNVQVAKIATERLLILMTTAELKRRGFPEQCFFPHDHYFGYEGRCAMPSNFDSNYCYALGHTAGALIDNGVTGYMAVVRGLHKPCSEWVPAGCPVTIMMNVERRKGYDVPVIRKYLVELDSPFYQAYKLARDAWKTQDCYNYPRAIQFEGPLADVTNFMIEVPAADYLAGRTGLRGADEVHVDTDFVMKALGQPEAHLGASGDGFAVTGGAAADEAAKVGVVLVGSPAPGVADVLCGVTARLGDCVVFEGLEELLQGQGKTVDAVAAQKHAHEGGFAVAGTSRRTQLPGNEKAVAEVVKKMGLSALVVLGDSTVGQAVGALCAVVSNVVFVPVSGAGNVAGVRGPVGFDTTAKTYASLVGNLLTDAASASKYWYFVKVRGGSRLALEVAAQTNVNGVLCAEKHTSLSSAVKYLADLVERRAEGGKNFGCVLLPESCLCRIPELAEMKKTKIVPAELAPAAVVESFRAALNKTTPSGAVDNSELPLDQLLAALVAQELKGRAFKGKYAPVCYYMGLQARAAWPSPTDCSLGLAHGCLAAMAAQSKVYGVMTTVATAASSENWKFGARKIGSQLEACATTDFDEYETYLAHQQTLAKNDFYCNPGPVQFSGEFSRLSLPGTQ
ncbi:phosphofructokinase [Gregarina niphandrodes]|uniref:Pyrophosphate--fructose 6-phosphate 1-phosphotransferase n=1 Tax=Gregarina niphandrodes TaxID=110365 RepID=A0A023AWQ6_GRENI|nr:phosphofructokinase [Gregarina niphandrodes]EZG43176.1 phosphofructokinase [Gregarina niphandrodes]|eukprot:XP_011133570.1 phosphofructokinase [Gregarina niphandrodes]